MVANSIGEVFRVTTFGLSHGKALGATVDGCPAGLELSEADIQEELNKRRPGTSKISTPRNESDKVEILSGIFNHKTDGTPITAIIRNKDQISKNYDNLRNNPRPGHGDYGWYTKYGNYDYRGGGRGSGRITVGHVIGGAVSKKLLGLYNISTTAHVIEIHGIRNDKKLPLSTIKENITKNKVRCADLEVAKQMEEEILRAKEDGNSVGGVVEIIIENLPAGLGQPVFDRMDGDLAKILMDIGAVKAVEVGLGKDCAKMTGREMNDEYILDDGQIRTTTNNAGGIVGGMTNGMPVVLRISVKPTPSISYKQKTVNLETNTQTTIQIEGRHDPCICPRITTVAQSACNMVVADHMIRAGHINPDRLE